MVVGFTVCPPARLGVYWPVRMSDGVSVTLHLHFVDPLAVVRSRSLVLIQMEGKPAFKPRNSLKGRTTFSTDAECYGKGAVRRGCRANQLNAMFGVACVFETDWTHPASQPASE